MSDEQLPEENSITSSEKQSKWFLGAIDVIAKGSGLLVALLYFSGLVIVNANFSKYGLTKISLANSKYLIAGVWYVVLIAICYRIYLELSKLYSEERPALSSLVIMLTAIVQLFVVNILLSFVGDRGQMLPEQLGTKKIYNVIWWTLVILSLLGSLLAVIWKKKRIETLAQWGSAAYTTIWSLNFFNAGEFLFLFLGFGLIRTSKVTIQKYLEKKEVAEQLGNLLVILLLSLWIFGRYVYAEISPEFGGGKIVPIEVRLTERFSGIDENLVTNNQVLKCNLIDRSDESIVVMCDTLTNFKAVEIRMNNIQTINYLEVSARASMLSKLFGWIEDQSKKSKPDSTTSISKK